MQELKKENAAKAMPNFSHPDEAEIIQILNHARSKAIADLRDLNVLQFAFETNKCDVNISSCDFDFGVHSPQINRFYRWKTYLPQYCKQYTTKKLCC